MDTYHLSRNGKALGQWPEAQMREFYAQGRVGPGDLVWKPGMAEWRRAADVFGFGEDAPPEADAAPPLAPAATAPAVRATPLTPPPPRLHWALVLLLGFVTFGLFFIVWAFVQAVWVRRVVPSSKGLRLLVAYLVLAVVGELLAATAPANDAPQALAGALLSFAGAIAMLVAYFSMRKSLLAHFNDIEPIDLKLSWLMTFFFNILYFQYHFTRIAKWRDGEGMTPQ